MVWPFRSAQKPEESEAPESQALAPVDSNQSIVGTVALYMLTTGVGSAAGTFVQHSTRYSLYKISDAAAFVLGTLAGTVIQTASSVTIAAGSLLWRTAKMPFESGSTQEQPTP